MKPPIGPFPVTMWSGGVAAGRPVAMACAIASRLCGSKVRLSPSTRGAISTGSG